MSKQRYLYVEGQKIPVSEELYQLTSPMMIIPGSYLLIGLSRTTTAVCGSRGQTIGFPFVEDAERISIYRAPGTEYNLGRCKHYVVEQAGNAIAALIELFGIEEMEKMIDQRQAKPNPKYEMMVKQEMERRKFFHYEDLLEIIRCNPEIARVEGNLQAAGIFLFTTNTPPSSVGRINSIKIIRGTDE